MPELPEVETMCRGVADTVGRRIARAEMVRGPRKPIQFTPSATTVCRRLTGKRIRGVERVGKRVVFHVDDGQLLVIEPRMTGLVLLSDPPTADHLRLRLHLSPGAPSQLLFWDRRGLGTVRLWSEREFRRQMNQGLLGPDALQVDIATLEKRFGQSKREIKVALLDQRAVAGIGNLYASEILHEAKIHPQRRCHLLTSLQWADLHGAMRKVLQAAIRYEGSTLSDGTYRNALNRRGKFQNHHRVYARAGELCDACQVSPIQRLVQAQRSTFFCPTCQTKRRNAHP